MDAGCTLGGFQGSPEKLFQSLSGEKIKSRQSKLTSFFIPTPSSNLKIEFKAAISDQSPSPKSGKSRKRKTSASSTSAKKGKKDQYVIDANQTRIGAQMCTDCGFVGDDDDEENRKMHDAFHIDFICKNTKGEICASKLITYLARNPGMVMASSGKDQHSHIKVFIVHHQSDPYILRETRAILSCVELQMQSTHSQHLSKHTDLVLLAIDTSEKKIVGCLAAEKIAHKDTFPRTLGIGINASDSNAYCGVYLIWIAPQQRRKEFGSLLVDCLRRRYTRTCLQYGAVLSEANLAFSDPTDNGVKFLQSYMGGREYRIYHR